DRAPPPVASLRPALGACLTSGIANVAAARGIELTKVSSTVEGNIDLLGILGLSDGSVRNGYQGIKVTFHVEGDADDATLRAVVEQSRRRSAVYDVLTQPTPVEIEVVPGCPPARHDGPRPATAHTPARWPARAARGTVMTTLHTIDTVVIGAGHAGLAVSRLLTSAGREHVVL